MTSKASSRSTRSDSRTPGSSSMTSTTGFGRVGSDTTISAPRLAGSGFLGRLEDHVLAAAALAALELHGHGIARLETANDLPELFDRADGASIDLQDQIAAADARRRGGAALGDIGDHHPRAARETVSPGEVRSQRLHGEPEPRAFRYRGHHGLVGRLLAALAAE